jgi:tetratricopeptide (TPR) repeat protein
MRLAWLLLLVSCAAHKAQSQALADPSNADAWEELGNAYRARLRHQMAVDAYRTAMQLDPTRTHLARRTNGSMSREARELKRAALRSPRDDEAWGDLGDMLVAEGAMEEARSAYMRALTIDPADSEWQQALATLGEVEFVARLMEGQLNQQDDESLGDYGDMLAMLGREGEACEHWRMAAELDPSDEEWINHALDCGYEVPDVPYDEYGNDYLYGVVGGTIEGEYGDAPEATDLESLVARVSSDASLLTRLGQAYAQARNAPKAEETLWGALLVAPTDEEALQSYMVVTGKTRRQVLETLRDTFSDNDEVVGLLADHYLDLGLRDRARDLYSLAHQLDPDDPEWRAKKSLLEAVR